MGFSFKDTARKIAGNNHFIMSTRTRIKFDEIIDKYPDGITITAFDLFDDKKAGRYPVIAFAEDDTKFAMGGGKMFADIISSWYDQYGDGETASDALKAQGGVKMRFSRRTASASGFQYIYVEIVE